MGNLSAARLAPSCLFATSEVNYARPYLVKDRTRTKANTKAYIYLFVCFVTKAVHIELAIDLSTNVFLNCLRRFISHRRLCHNIYPDYGTNFIEAQNELFELKKLISNKDRNSEIAQFLLNKEIQRHIIPPRASHFGGLWESSIKSAKTHLKRVIGDSVLTYEELYTILVQIEAFVTPVP